MVKLYALAVVAYLASLLPQNTSAAPSHGASGSLQIPQRTLSRRDATSSLIIKSVTCHESWSGWHGVQKIFSLYVVMDQINASRSLMNDSGDSYTDAGFNPTGPQPNATYPLGNPFSNSSTPPYHTFTNGPNWIEYLTFKYNESLVDTYNLTVSGSTVNNTVLGVSSTADLVHQISDRFVPSYVRKNTAGWTSSNSLFALFFGINDVNRSWNKRNPKINDAVFSSYLNLLNSVSSCLKSENQKR